ncbi:4Fe-4S dicluster domain-containing protein [Methanosphaerula palustris]|uniref:4Fe-4S dicluster domain-containing protein n=1 Tax=Methanosphaerula palustris TaxID=475088 RepID=UPI0022A8D534|nr:4Fe-4S dicluster domain-containing protein [Methanosphaerula palustris]
MTITVDPETCTRCGICSDVCLRQIIVPAENGELPHLEEGKSTMCISCGQCEVYCPTGAITQDFATSGGRTRTDLTASEKILSVPLGTFIRNRRSIRTCPGGNHRSHP